MMRRSLPPPQESPLPPEPPPFSRGCRRRSRRGGRASSAVGAPLLERLVEPDVIRFVRIVGRQEIGRLVLPGLVL